MTLLRVSLEQWQAFIGIVREGSYAAASKKLHKSQPTLSYLIKKIEDTLNVSLFTIHGRKSELTPIGKTLYHDALKLIGLAREIESQAKEEALDYEPILRLVVDEIYPISLLMAALRAFSALELPTRLILKRGILSEPCEQLQNKQADIAITFKPPHDVIAEHLTTVSSAPFASEDHSLHRLDRRITVHDLVLERQIIVMDPNPKHSMNFGFLSTPNAWYVDTLEMKLQLLAHGLGYAWLNEALLAERKVPLKELPFDGDAIRHHSLYLAYRNPFDALGPASRLLIQLLKAQNK